MQQPISDAVPGPKTPKPLGKPLVVPRTGLTGHSAGPEASIASDGAQKGREGMALAGVLLLRGWFGTLLAVLNHCSYPDWRFGMDSMGSISGAVEPRPGCGAGGCRGCRVLSRVWCEPSTTWEGKAGKGSH